LEPIVLYDLAPGKNAAGKEKWKPVAQFVVGCLLRNTN
jgi:hypothetical protein